MCSCCPQPGDPGSGGSGTGQQSPGTIDSGATETPKRPVDLDGSLPPEEDHPISSSLTN